MAIEIIDNPQGDMLAAAFDLIEREIKAGKKFSNEQKDLGIRMSIDALAPDERPWFFEVAMMNKIPLWQTLWGQWRRCQENGMAQAPVLDPGWEGMMTGDYGMEERPCKECGETFKPGNPGQLWCSNKCGAAEEKRQRGIVDEPVVERTPDELSTVMPRHVFDYFQPEQPAAEPDPDRPVDLGVDFVETE